MGSCQRSHRKYTESLNLEATLFLDITNRPQRERAGEGASFLLMLACRSKPGGGDRIRCFVIRQLSDMRLHP